MTGVWTEEKRPGNAERQYTKNKMVEVEAYNC